MTLFPENEYLQKNILGMKSKKRKYQKELEDLFKKKS